MPGKFNEDQAKLNDFLRIRERSKLNPQPNVNKQNRTVTKITKNKQKNKLISSCGNGLKILQFVAADGSFF